MSVLLLAGSILGAGVAQAQTRTIEPLLAFPEAGLDDPAAYQGYQTRFYRDAGGNAVQIYLDARTGRAVTVLADAVNESVGFTVRDGGGNPQRVEWGSTEGVISGTGSRRSIEYQLVANAPRIQIGWILLGSMRVERDLVYSGRHLKPFASPTFPLRELDEMIVNLQRLEPAERGRHLQLLNVRGVPELRRRLQPTLTSVASASRRAVMATQAAFDGKTHIELELGVDPRQATVITAGRTISIRARSGRSIRFTVRVTTDAPSLTPLARNEIFNAAFLRFADSTRASADAAVGGRSRMDSAVIARSRRLERDMRGVELLGAKEKLMAGMPNYATYFGRDMMMTALMMEPVWSDAMAEHVIASVLRKLGPAGDVSHEEALGGQAIRENAAEYNARVGRYFQATRSGDRAAAGVALSEARALLGNLQAVRENFNMLDDEFQLPVLAARYLGNPSVPAARKMAFLMDSSDGRGPRVDLLLRELRLVTAMAAPYAREPAVQNLVGSPRQDSTRWRSVSWRDSGAGYANGRFAMDINAIWVPRALESISTILASFKQLGFAPERVAGAAPGSAETTLGMFARDPESLRRAVQTWNGAARHFIVSLSADEIRAQVERKLRSLPAGESAYWQRVLSTTAADRQPLEFLAVSLDAAGRPIRVVNSDPATWLFLHDGRDSLSVADRARATRDVRAFMRAYPVGLFVDSLGPLVANDAYASPEVWEAFRRDLYHSPRVVWGREVNLFMLGLVKQIATSVDASGRPRNPALASYVRELREALRRVIAAVDASALKHNELWSYEIAGGRLVPIRYGASTDIQLWNITALAVQFALSQLVQ
ncbi:MAG: hypothetical protein H0T48_08800 [Gemmatimonadaceae bacterium]|nr:hypothetical protein [Gemmatimonadaceae bacterium]